VAAVLFIRAGFRRTPVRNNVFSRAMRGSVGCLGVFIGIVTMIVWVSVGPGGGGSNDDDERPSAAGLGLGSATSGVLGAVAGAVVEEAFEQAGTLAEAEEATRDFVEASEELGVEPEDLRRVLTGAVPDDAPWAADAPAMFDRLLPAPVSEPIESRDAAAIRDEVSLYTTDEALEAYAALLRSGRAEDMDVARREALEARLTLDVAADTLAELEARIEDLDDDLREAEEDLSETRAELDELESRGVFSTFRSFLDELGFGFGWASLYFTVMLSWWKGQTIGKRVLRIRVLRLDGEPITWWVAFERAGGYAAGLATGLLGFAQVYWDANRQAIHDRIAGTVVALDPPQRVLDWESVL
jgi:predicted transcriptional regulator